MRIILRRGVRESRLSGAQGSRSLSVSCWLRHYGGVLSADLGLPWFAPRMVCTHCGIIGAVARPNWKERPDRP
jgi:hypothetical protein